MTNTYYGTTYDEKIMNFNTGKGYDAFYDMFDDDEIYEMRSWLEREYDYNYDWATEKEARDLVAIDYVKEWLCDNIRNMRYDGTEQLFDIIYNMD